MGRPHTRWRLVLVCLLGALVAGFLPLEPVLAQESGARTLAIQNRLHTQRHEFGGGIGLLPLDAFTKGLTVSGAYTLHFNDLLAWEVIQGAYAFGIDTSLKADLESLAQPVGPTPFETVRFFASSNAVFKFGYGKLSILNRALVYHELYALAGGGYGRLTLTHRPAVDLGFGVRIYTPSRLSIRIEARDYLFLNPADVQNELWLTLGIGLSFGGKEGAWRHTY